MIKTLQITCVKDGRRFYTALKFKVVRLGSIRTVYCQYHTADPPAHTRTSLCPCFVFTLELFSRIVVAFAELQYITVNASTWRMALAVYSHHDDMWLGTSLAARHLSMRVHGRTGPLPSSPLTSVGNQHGLYYTYRYIHLLWLGK